MILDDPWVHLFQLHQLEAWALCHARPNKLVRRAANLRNLVELVQFVFPRKDGLLRVELAQDATGRPYVDRRAVLLFPEQQFWWPVPQGDDPIRVPPVFALIVPAGLSL